MVARLARLRCNCSSLSLAWGDVAQQGFNILKNTFQNNCLKNNSYGTGRALMLLQCGVWPKGALEAITGFKVKFQLEI